MIKKLLLLYALVTFSNIVCAQQSTKNKLAQLIQKLYDAMVDADEKKLEEMVAENVSYGHSSGLVEDKKTFIQKIISGQSNFEKVNLSNINITIHKNIAVCRHQLTAETKDNGVDGSVNLWVLQIWMKEKKHWRLLARQSTRVSP